MSEWSSWSTFSGSSCSSLWALSLWPSFFSCSMILSLGISPCRSFLVRVVVLSGIRRLFARPRARCLRKARARSVIEETLDDTEERALDQERKRELREVDPAVLRAWRVLVVEAAPDEVEQLLRELPGGEAADDAERQEEQLHDFS